MLRVISLLVAASLFGSAIWLWMQPQPAAPIPENSMAAEFVASVLPANEVSAAMQSAHESIFAAADDVRTYRVIADLLMLLVTVLGALTALGAGLRGLGIESQMGAILLVVVGALSGGSSAGASWLNDQAGKTAQCIEQVQRVRGIALNSVRNASDIEVARQHLAQLEAKRRACFA